MGLVAMRGNGDVPHVVEMVDVGVVTDVGSHHARNPNGEGCCSHHRP